MTDDELKAIEHDFDVEWRPSVSAERERHGRALLAEVRRLTTELAMAQASDERQELRADNARLRAVIALGEHRSQHCDWCDAFRKPSAGDKEPHRPDCPAFTESGDVR
jgi:hypothetical protein